MSDTLITKNGSGDNNLGNRVGAQHIPSTATHKEVTFVLKAGTKDDTKVSYIKFKSTATDPEIMAWAVAFDNVSGANLSQVKKTLSLNSNKDIPALSEVDKNQVLVAFEVTYNDDTTDRKYIAIPYALSTADFPVLRTFIEANMSQLYFGNNVLSVKLHDVYKSYMR